MEMKYHVITGDFTESFTDKKEARMYAAAHGTKVIYPKRFKVSIPPTESQLDKLFEGRK